MKSMGSGSGIRQRFLSGIELLSVTSRAKAFAPLVQLANDTKASCSCLLQHQISNHYRICQHFCHMWSFKSTNIVSEAVKYDSPDLNRGGTIRENLCRVGYRVRKLKSETSSNLQKFLSHRVNGTINKKQLTMLSLWHIYLAFVNLIPAAKGLGQCLADTSTGTLRQATRWHCTAGRIKQRWKQSYPHNVIERATTNKLYKLINFINLSSQHSLTLHLWRYERNDDGLPFNQSWSYPSSRRI